MNFLFYDLETSGLDECFDQIFQFAAIRTDENFNQIGEPIEYFCKLRSDVLPAPIAIKINQIDVRELDAKGLCEFEFARSVEATLQGDGDQCIIGYNSTDFDDKFIRFLLYRNLLPPYDWTWVNGNSCFDLFPVLCLGYSFGRLSGIKIDDGSEPLRLENLAKCNDLIHEQAHDAVSDVKATIELAKLLREKCPKLLDHALSLRDRVKVRQIATANDVFCLSTKTNGYDDKFLGLNTQICDHPIFRTSVITWKLKCDPANILDLTADEILDRMYAKGDDRTIDVGFEELKINKSPMVVPFSGEVPMLLRDHDLCVRNLNAVRANLSQLKSLAGEIFNSEIPERELDADLYVGFFQDVDRDQRGLQAFRKDPMNFKPSDFTVKRFRRQLLRLKARNFPDMLSASENERYLRWRADQRLGENPPDGCLCWTEFEKEFLEAIIDPQLTERQALCLRGLREHIAKIHGREITS